MMLPAGAILLLLASESAPAPPDRAVVLPVTLPDKSPQVLTQLAAALEGSWSQAIIRHASFGVMTRLELTAMLTAEMRRQLEGCDVEGCLTEIGEALGAPLLVRSRLGMQGPFFLFQAALLDRRTATTVRRASIKAATVDQLLEGLDGAARHLCGAAAINLADANITLKLGTDAATVARLGHAVHQEPDDDATHVWTRFIIQQNREAGWLALLEGALLWGAAGVLALSATAAGVAQIAALGSWPRHSVYGATTRRVPAAAFLPHALFLLGAALIAPLLVAALTVALVDRADLGRIPVSRGGCCRDEEDLEQQEQPTTATRLAPLLALGGVVTALLSPMCFLVPYGAAIFCPPCSPPQPSVSVDKDRSFAVQQYSQNVLVAAFILPVAVAAAAVVGGMALVATERSSLLDSAAPAEKSTASPR